jgi:hypothetical protein
MDDGAGSRPRGSVCRIYRTIDREGIHRTKAYIDLVYIMEQEAASLAALVLVAGQRKGNAAFALADLLSRRGLERPCKALVDAPSRLHRRDRRHCRGGHRRSHCLDLPHAARRQEGSLRQRPCSPRRCSGRCAGGREERLSRLGRSPRLLRPRADASPRLGSDPSPR